MMRKDERTHSTTATPHARPVSSGVPVLSPAPAGIRADRVARARARLAAGLLPLSAEDLADAILRAAAHDRLCRA